MRSHHRCRIAAALTAVALALAGAGCGDDDTTTTTGGGGAGDVRQYAAGTTMGKIQRKGEITVGVKYDVPPFGF
jgi:ABC-type amino acid transport substrate-binding protein